MTRKSEGKPWPLGEGLRPLLVRQASLATKTATALTSVAIDVMIPGRLANTICRVSVACEQYHSALLEFL